MEQTFFMIKPDGVRRGLIGSIISRLETKGFRLVALKMLTISPEMAREHYAEHQGKSFFNELTDFITSGPVVAMVWEGPAVIKAVRTMMGATDPAEADPGTIRGDMAVSLSENVVHGSDSPIAAAREIGLFFRDL
ncbi:MAG: nucleoside-diphosphate kinase [Syntrophomonadaceae bacterium]|nr:nucleoside-diphosphate kinase [Syntrophomonadaceae bacterium]